MEWILDAMNFKLRIASNLAAQEENVRKKLQKKRNVGQAVPEGLCEKCAARSKQA